MEYQVLLFYKYIDLADPEVVALRLRSLALQYGLLGRAIIATEGVNATFEGTAEATEAFVNDFFEDERFADIQVKRSVGNGKTFPKLSVKVREEMVGTHLKKEEADPLRVTGTRLSADELHEWYKENKDFVVVDMRNDYEYASGHFKNSIDPGLRASRDLPEAMPKLEPLKNKTVVTVCTGGVRCEKMSSYLLNQGFKDVYQLEGGIHTYLEKYPIGEFKGTLYTFDQRVTMDFDTAKEVIGACRLCGEKTEKYVNCVNVECHLHFLACEGCHEREGSAPACSSACAELVTSSSSALV